MGITAEEVLIKLEASVDTFNAKISDAERAFSRSMSNIEQAAARAQATTAATGRVMGESISGAGAAVGRAGTLIGAGLAAVAAGFVAAATDAIEYAAGLADVAHQSGLTVEQVQILNRAGREFNFTTDQMTNSLQGLNRKLGEARSGTASAMQAFRSIGITKDQLDSYQSASDLLPRVMAAVAGLRSESERAAAAQRLGINPALLTFLDQGAEGYKRMAEEAREAGLITTDQAERAAQARDRVAELGDTLRNRLAIGIAATIPLLENFVANLSDVASEAASAVGWLLRMTSVQIPALQRQGTPVTSAPFNYLAIFSGNPRVEGADRGRSIGRSIVNAAGGIIPPGAALDPATDPRTPKPRSRRGPRDHSAQDQEYVDQQILGFSLDILHSLQSSTTDYVERYNIGRQIAAVQRQQYVLELDYKQKTGHLSETQARTLRAEYDRAAAAQLAADNQELSANYERERAQIASDEHDRAVASLQVQDRLAETSSERRDIELRILDIDTRYERARLQAMLAAEDLGVYTQRELIDARQRLATLDRDNEQRRQQIVQQTRGPLDQFLADLPTTAAKAQEALERVAVDGMGRISDGLADAILMTRSWGDVFKDVARQILSDLLRIQIEKSLIGPLAGALGGLFGGASKLGGAQGVGGSIVKSILGGIPGLAVGGPVSAGEPYLVGEKGPELFMPRAAGSIIPAADTAKMFSSYGSVAVSPAAPTAAPQQVTLRIVGPEDWRAEVAEISAGVTVQIQQSREPAVVRAATSNAVRLLTKPSLNGG